MALVNGIETLGFGQGACTRASGAYNPDTGKLLRANRPRITENRFAVNTWEPKIFHTFDPSETKMEYDTTDNNLLSRQATFEAEFPEFTRINLGFSFQSRSIFAYRLGPANRKHFVQINGVHGNEIDGVNGSFKAMEVLAREAEFMPFRDEYTLLFIPTLNPDGWKLGTRNLAQTGPNGNTINLNRNFDWFWDEYVETASESKGATAESTAEAQALLNYLRTANGGGAVPKGALLDFHANQGTGARYQSRDRIWREISDSSYGTVDIPNGRITQYIDWWIWRTMMSLSTKRQLENGGPELWIRYLRSRFRPHLHSYHSSIGWTSIATEELKVDNANGYETYKSAADYRTDYILTIAQMVTSANWSFDDAILIENAAENIHNNAEFEQWQTADERPGNWNYSRSQITRHTHIPEQLEAPEESRLYDNGGSGLEVRSDTDLTLATNEEFTGAASARVGEIGFLLPGARNWYRFILEQDFNAAEIFGSPMTRTTLYGSGVVNSGDGTVDILGGGTAAPSTGAVAAATRLTTDVGSESETNLTGVLNAARMFHGTADNFLALPTTPASRLGWVFGGFDSLGSRLTSIEEWDPNGASGQGVAATQTAVLPIALAECTAVHDPVSNKVFIFGGSTSGAAAVNTIYVWDVVGDSMSTHTATLPVALKHIGAAYVPFNKRIYLFGGEDASGDMQEEVYVFNPADATAGAIVQEDTRQNLGDDEDLEVPGGESGPWATAIGRWGATTLLEDAGDGIGAVYLGGGRLTNTAGATLSTIYRYDPPDMIIGLPRESDYGYFRFSVSSVDRQYAYKLDVTKGASSDFFRRNDDIDFSSGAIDNDVMEYVSDTATRGLRLDAEDVDAQADIRPGDTFSGPRGSGTVNAVPYDNFPSLDETNQWEDPSAVWAGGTNEAVASGTGPLKLRNLPDFVNQKLSVDVEESGAAGAHFATALRGTYSGATLTDGYRVIYDEDDTEWRIERVVSSTPTTIFTLDVGADANRQVTSTKRTLLVRVEDKDPVHIVVTFNSLSIADIFDLTETRIVVTGQVACESTASSGGNEHRIAAFNLKTAGWREGQYASSVAVRAVDGTVSGYTRQVSQTKDDSSDAHPLGANIGDADDFSLRYLRNYYTLPPSQFWAYYRTRLDMTESARNQKEDGFRYYVRTYKHNQRHYVSGPCTVEGLIPHTFVHPESPAADEIFTYAGVINLNSFRLEFKWSPTFGHPDIQGTSLELLRLSIDANNYIRLVIEAQDRDEREYNLDDVHGGHDPKFTLEKVRGGSVVDSVSVICYYGYDNREPSMETVADTLVFTLDHFTGSGGYLALEIEKYKTRGRSTSTSDLVAYSGNSVGNLIYNGVGWYGTPRIIVQDQSSRTNNRKLPVYRSNLHLRGRPFDAPTLHSGDRDPTFGQRVFDNPYELPEDFNRSDSGNLGTDWDQIQVDGDVRNAGDGFDIVSNAARAYGTQFERWDARPAHRDYVYKAKVLVQADLDLVGLFARYPNEFFAFGGEICGLGVELVQTGTTSANVRLVAWWLSNRTVLSTAALSSYTQGTQYEMRITCNGSSLTGEVFDLGDLEVPIGTTSTTSTLFLRPGRLGIYCEAPTNFVTIDDVSAEPLFPDELTD